MSSKTEICNLALSHLGAYTIAAFNADSQEARKCRIFYDPSRKFVLRKYPWNFAEKRVALSELDVDITGYTYAYAYPTDCLDARLIYNPVSGLAPINFIVTTNDDLNGRMILTDHASAVLIYTADVEDVNVFDPTFTFAFSYHLASSMAIAITRKQSLAQALLTAYVSYMSTAETANATESKDSKEQANPYVTARG